MDCRSVWSRLIAKDWWIFLILAILIFVLAVIFAVSILPKITEPSIEDVFLDWAEEQTRSAKELAIK